MTNKTSPPIPVPPGYKSLVPFDRVSHRNKGIAEHASQFATKLHAIYLTQVEIPRAALDYPVVFARDTDGNIVPVALVGVEPNKNLLCDSNGRWSNNDYVPAYVRRYPFFLARVNAEGDGDEDGGENHAENRPKNNQEKAQNRGSESRSLICVDESALDSKGKVLIAADGETTAAWSELEKLIQEVDLNQHSTAKFCARLESLGLLEKFDADFHPQQPSEAATMAVDKVAVPARINGLFRINRKSLEGLPDADLLALVRDQSITTIEAHLNSLNRFNRLLNLYAVAATKMS